MMGSLPPPPSESSPPSSEQRPPPLIAAYDQLPATDTLKTKLAEPIAALRSWDFRWGAESVPTSVAIFWGERMRRAGSADLLGSLAAAVDALTRDFGTWKTPWGE